MQFVRALDSAITVFHQGAILIEGPAEQGARAITNVREVYHREPRMSIDEAGDTMTGEDARDRRAPSRTARCSRSATCTPATATVPVLHGVSLQLFEGEAIGIVGHNGMGKTTLLKAVMGLLPVTRRQDRRSTAWT